MRVVRSGTWKYDGSVDKPVDIVSFDFDWWYELAATEGSLGAAERPRALGPDGVLYYVRFRKAGSLETPTWLDSEGHADLDEAVSAAEATAPSPIRWTHA